MFRKCCVPKCSSLRKDVKFHKLPRNEQSRTRWLKCIYGNANTEVAENMYVCHKHFEQRFVNPTTQCLKCYAYPTLFADLEISSGNPSTVFVQPVSCEDHTYTRKRRHIDHSYAQTLESTPNKVLSLEHNVTSTITPVEHAVASTSTAIEYTPVPCSLNLTEHAVASTSTTIADNNSQVSGSSCKTPKRLTKRRLLTNVKSLTPRCQLLYKEYKNAKRQTHYISRAKKALAFSKEKSLEDLTKNMNPLAKSVLWMQVKLCTKNKKARRFTREEKLIALSIYKQGPKSYKFLQKIFILPSKSTLKKMISDINIDAGINTNIFHHLKQQVTKWDEKKKLCTIIYDEMAIETALTYAAHIDNIIGFVDLNGKINQFADHTLVFMLRGAVFKWQQPIAFYFCEGATSSLKLKGIIKSIVAAVTDSGLTPIALVSDQGSAFQSAVNSLLVDTKREQLRAGETVDDTIHLSGNSISIVYDPPHLIKGIRNNLLTKDMMFEGKRVSWNDIVDVYNADCKHGEARLLHKLTDQHVIPDKIKKMKVRNCVRVLSKSVAAALSYTSAFPLYPDGAPVSKTLKNTAEAVSFFDDLFDSVNGANTDPKFTRGKNLRKAATSKSAHHEFWNRAIKILEGTRFICKDGSFKSVPSIKNWVITLKSFQRLWGLLASKNIAIMRPRYFNSDVIENFFGQVRAYNYRSNDPTAYAFVNTFKSLLITRFINFHSENYNCEDDSSKCILNIQSLFVDNAPSSEPSLEIPVLTTRSIQLGDKNIEEQARRERINIHSRAYTAGWVTRKILSKVNCSKCRQNLLAENSSIHNFIEKKEYKAQNMRKLTYPAEEIVISFGNVIKTTNEYLEQQGHKADVSKSIKKEICSKYSFSFLNCAMHKEMVFQYFLNISVKLCIFNWCNVINKILKGTDIFRAEKVNLQPMQAKALLKYKKKIKNKKFNK